MIYRKVHFIPVILCLTTVTQSSHGSLKSPAPTKANRYSTKLKGLGHPATKNSSRSLLQSSFEYPVGYQKMSSQQQVGFQRREDQVGGISFQQGGSGFQSRYNQQVGAGASGYTAGGIGIQQGGSGFQSRYRQQVGEGASGFMAGGVGIQQGGSGFQSRYRQQVGEGASGFMAGGVGIQQGGSGFQSRYRQQVGEGASGFVAGGIEIQQLNPGFQSRGEQVGRIGFQEVGSGLQSRGEQVGGIGFQQSGSEFQERGGNVGGFGYQHGSGILGVGFKYDTASQQQQQQQQQQLLQQQRQQLALSKLVPNESILSRRQQRLGGNFRFNERQDIGTSNLSVDRVNYPQTSFFGTPSLVNGTTNYCPPGQYVNYRGRCVLSGAVQQQCPECQRWDVGSNQCVPCCPIKQFCPQGMVQDITSGKCICPQGWTQGVSGNCILAPCPAGQYRDTLSGQCVCPSGTTLDQFTGQCNQPSCPQGEYWNPTLGTCVRTTCPPGTQYDGMTGQCVPFCQPGTTWDPRTGQCRCRICHLCKECVQSAIAVQVMKCLSVHRNPVNCHSCLRNVVTYNSARKLIRARSKPGFKELINTFTTKTGEPKN